MVKRKKREKLEDKKYCKCESDWLFNALVVREEVHHFLQILYYGGNLVI